MNIHIILLNIALFAAKFADSFLYSTVPRVKPFIRNTDQYHLREEKKLSTLFTHLESQTQEGDPKTKQKVLLQDKMLYKIGSTTSTFVAGTFFVVLAYQRDAFMLTFFTGSILNGITSKLLKKVLNQDRPVGYEQDSSIKVKPSDKGMPSSHAMSLGFIGIYTAIALCTEVLMTYGFAAQIAACTSLVVYIVISLVYRVKSQLHTTDQVIAGLFFGSKYYLNNESVNANNDSHF